MLYKLLADSVVAVHLAYVGFVVVAQALILIGLVCRWPWVRNLRFRVIHLVMVEVVALEGWFGIICPMTDWDNQLRAQVQNEVNTVAVQSPEPKSAPPESAALNPAAPEAAPEPPAPMPTAPTPAAPEPAAPEPAAEPAPPAADDGQATFVGKLLSSILYVEVPQRVLDTWYVRFGLVTLGLFVLFPPRVGRWSAAGLAGVILLWTGLLFTCAAIHQRITLDAAPAGDSMTPLEFGVWMMLLGAACFWWGWSRSSRAPAESTTAAAGSASV